MKIESFEILFDDEQTNPHGVYHSGQNIVFRVHLKLREAVRCAKVTVTLLGKSKVKWTEQKSKYSSKTYQSEEIYIDHTIVIFTPDSDGPNEGKHPAGEYFYPFGFHLPETAPSSFEGVHGIIRYFIKANMDRPWKTDNYAQKYFTVVRDLDLNAMSADDIGPFTSAEEAPVYVCSCFGCGKGKVRINAALSKRGYVPGEQLHVTGDVINSSHTDLDIVIMDIYQHIMESADNRMKETERVASSAQLPPIRRGESLRLNHLLPVPAVPASYLDGCSNIELHYFFRIRAGDGCCVSFKHNVCELRIGTVPLQTYLMITIVPDPAQQQQQSEAVGPAGVPVVSAQPAAALEYMPLPNRQHYAECAFGRVNMDRAEGVCHCFQEKWAPSYPMMVMPQPYQMQQQQQQHWQQQQQQQQQLQPEDIQLQPLLHSHDPSA